MVIKELKEEDSVNVDKRQSANKLNTRKSMACHRFFCCRWEEFTFCIFDSYNN